MNQMKSKYPPVEIPKSELIPKLNEKGEVKGMDMKFRNMRLPLQMIEKGYMPDPRVSFDKIKEMTIYDDDILICAAGKAGTHWLWEITSMLNKGVAEYEQVTKESNMLDFHLPEQFDNISRPRVLNTHLPFNMLPNGILEKRCRILFIQRNPKDLLVSGYNHSKHMIPPGVPPLLWDDYLYFHISEQAYLTPWYLHMKGYEEVLDDRSDHILPLFYEDLKKDAVAEVKKIAAFLKTDCSDTLAIEIAEKCNFKNLKEADKKKRNDFEADLNFLYRKGEVGDWKNWFTVAQNERMDAFIAEKTKGSRFKYQYSL